METVTETKFNPCAGGAIDLEVAAGWTKNYREKHPHQTISHFFGRGILEEILAQDDCVGIRFYHAYDHDGKKHLVIVGVHADGKDQSPVHGHPVVYKTGDQSTPCPGSPGCPKGLLAGGGDQ